MGLRSDFRALRRVEPLLGELERDIRRHAKEHQHRSYYCANTAWHGADRGFRKRMRGVVGFQASREEVRTMDAYDIAYEYLYALLPDCRNCGCSPD